MPMKTVKLDDIHSNPFRTDEAYSYSQPKIDSLKESIADTSFWENLLARVTATGIIQLAYGHHRLQALKQLRDEGMTEFNEIKINVRSEKDLTPERMLKILAQENKDDWQDSPENLCMTVLQIKAHLQGVLNASKDAEDFMQRLGDKGSLAVNSRSFARMKNSGIGPSIIAQFLGDTWSRNTIESTVKLLQAGEQSEKLKELANTLPNISLAFQFQKFLTKDSTGTGDNRVVTFFEDDVKKEAAAIVHANNLTQRDIAKAEKILKEQGAEEKDPVAALKQVVSGRKDELKAFKEAQKANRPTPPTAMERIEGKFQSLLETVQKYNKDLTTEDLEKIKANLQLVAQASVYVPPPEESEGEGKVEAAAAG